MSAGFCPDHKAAMVLFLDRVYGIEDQNFLLHLLEVGFLPDLRAAASLDTVSASGTPLHCIRKCRRVRQLQPTRLPATRQLISFPEIPVDIPPQRPAYLI